MSRVETRHSQFGLISEVVQPKSDLTIVADLPGMFAPEARKGQLFILIELEQGTSRTYESSQMVMRIIRKQFYEDPSFSIISSLRKAIVAANKALYQQNFNTGSQKRILIGATCAVIKGSDLFVAQVMPAQIYTLSAGRLRAIPPSPAWGTAPLPSSLVRMKALGASLTIEPELYRSTLNPGEAALLASSNLAPILDRDLVFRLLRSGDLASASSELGEIARVAAIGDAHALFVGVYPIIPANIGDQQRSAGGIAARGRVVLRTVEDLIARAGSEIVLTLRGPMERIRLRRNQGRITREAAEQQRLYELPEQPMHSPDPIAKPRPLDLGETLDERLSQERESRRSKIQAVTSRPIERRLPPSAMLGEPSYTTSGQPERRIDLGDPTPKPGKQPVEPAFRDQPQGTLGRLNTYFARGRRERRLRQPPPRSAQQSQRIPGLSYRRETPPFPWVWLITLTCLVAVLITYGVTLSTQNQIREVDDGLTSAEKAVAQIFEAPDEASARERLREAAAAIDAVRATGILTNTTDGLQRFEVLTREYDQALTSIRKISYFERLEDIATNPRTGAQFDSVIIPPAPRGITDTIPFASIYLLDSSSGVLYQQPKSGGTLRAILNPQDVVGPLPVGQVIGASWRFDTIVAVAQSGAGEPYNLFFRNGQQWSYSLLAGSEEWGTNRNNFRVASYEGNLYIWGATPGNILRYRSGEYGSFPDPWVQDDGGIPFDSSLDMAIDGRIYLLQPDGRVLVYGLTPAGQRGFLREIKPDPSIDPPIQTITRFYVTGEPENGFIFLVDGYNSRILQIDKATGEFIQQIKAAPDDPKQIDNLISVAVDTNAGRPEVYLVNETHVYRAPLPDRPRPFREGTPDPATTPNQITPTP
jgi:hypothetical protein